MPIFNVSSARRLLALGCGIVFAAACGSDATAPTAPNLTALGVAQLGSLDSAARSLVDSNPTNPDLKALLDSTLLVLTAGVPVAQFDLTMNAATVPLNFVGIHRAFQSATGSSFSTWTLVGFDDPSHLTSLVEASGFSAAGGPVAPSSVNGTIGDGSGLVNALFLQVAPGGQVAEWYASAGAASFSSESVGAGAPCPGFASTATVTCTIETMHVHFTANAPSGTSGQSGRQFSLPTDVAVPTMKLTYQF